MSFFKGLRPIDLVVSSLGFWKRLETLKQMLVSFLFLLALDTQLIVLHS